MAKTKKKIIYKYDIEMRINNLPGIPVNLHVGEELIKVLKYVCDLDDINKTYDFTKEEKIILLDSVVEVNINNGWKMYNTKFISAKYNQAREVINKNTLENKGRLKAIEDGDIEVNHVTFYYNENQAIAAFEYNDYGIFNLNKIIEYINNFLGGYFEYNELIPYINGFECHNKVNKNFIEKLERLDTINAATIILSKRYLNSSPFAALAEKDEVKDEIAITFKRSKRNNQLPIEEIKECYDKISSEDNIVKKIYIEGSESANTINFNTEEMKEKVEINVELNTFGEVESEDMFNKQKIYLME